MLLLLALCLDGAQLAASQPLQRNIIKVRASGFLPFESDLLLPLGILRQLQAQERASRLLPELHTKLHTKLPRRRTKVKPKPKQQVRLERARGEAGMQLYNLIDDDGELLLNLRVHTDGEGSNNNAYSKSNSYDNNNSLLEGETAAPWRPSKWRPTSSPPLMVSSSSPRPLPLHQYLSSNS
ncbi:hypothetical protein KR222_004721, partial [Zaprionus bogoriensis]